MKAPLKFSVEYYLALTAPAAIALSGDTFNGGLSRVATDILGCKRVTSTSEFTRPQAARLDNLLTAIQAQYAFVDRRLSGGTIRVRVGDGDGWDMVVRHESNVVWVASSDEDEAYHTALRFMERLCGYWRRRRETREPTPGLFEVEFWD